MFTAKKQKKLFTLFFELFIYNHLKGTSLQASHSQIQESSCGGATGHRALLSAARQHPQPELGQTQGRASGSHFSQDTWPGGTSTRLPSVRGSGHRDLLPECSKVLCAGITPEVQWYSHKTAVTICRQLPFTVPENPSPLWDLHCLQLEGNPVLIPSGECQEGIQLPAPSPGQCRKRAISPRAALWESRPSLWPPNQISGKQACVPKPGLKS